MGAWRSTSRSTRPEEEEEGREEEEEAGGGVKEEMGSAMGEAAGRRRCHLRCRAAVGYNRWTQNETNPAEIIRHIQRRTYVPCGTLMM